jgi:hypothetical protein
VTAAAPEPAASPAPSAPSAPSSAPSPAIASNALVVVASGPAAAPEKGSTFSLDIEILRRSPNGSPMLLQVDLPWEITLVGGQSTETIVDADAPLVNRTLVLRAEDVPSSDIAVTVRTNVAQGPVYATAPFRFGPREASPAVASAKR